jgi:cobalt-zinc-cadmium efflux system outer membrane protein
VDNSVRLAHADVLHSRDLISEYRNVLIPQRVETVARAQEELIYMLIGVFEVLAMKQEEYNAYQAYLGSVRDYWQSRARLAMAVGSSLPSSQATESQAIDTGELLQTSPNDTDHSDMDHSKMDHSDPDQSNPDHSEHDKHNDHSDHSDHSGKPSDNPGAAS